MKKIRIKKKKIKLFIIIGFNHLLKNDFVL